MAVTEQSVFIQGNKLTESGLKSIIAAEMDNALGVDGGKLSVQRRDALKWYLGEKYGNEVEGRSQVVDRTVLETVEWVLPALLRIFYAGDKVAQVEPQEPADEESARQQTEYMNYILMRDNKGFQILHTWFKDALLQKLGWVKVFWDIERKIETEKYRGLTDEQYQAIIADPNVEVISNVQYPAFGPAMGLIHSEEVREGEEPNPGNGLSPLAPSPAGKQMPPGIPSVWDCTLRRTKNEGRVKIIPVAPEEMLVSRRATSVQDSPFVCHRRKCTHTELIEAGFDFDTVMNLTPFDEQEYNTERIQRFQKNDEWPYRSSRTDPPMVEVWVNECYVRVDWDNDGLAELRKITVAGDKEYVILDNVEIDEIPFVAITPIPMPHILFGLSLADVVNDLQLIKTVIWRQMLDNLYLANNPRHYVNELQQSENTMDDLLTSRPGSVVRAIGPMEGAIAPLTTPFIAAQSFPMIQYLEQTASKRSGVNDGNQGIAPDDLNKNSKIGSMGVDMLQEAAAQRVELIARVFAEGVRELCERILGLVARNQQSPRIIKLTGQWTPVDPTSWKHSFELTVTVGLGTGNKDKMVAQLMQILQLQMQAIGMQKGIQGPLVTGNNIFQTVKRLVQTMGFKAVSDFISDPATTPMPPQQPDPMLQAEQQKTQAKSQSEAAELAMRERLGVAELQMDYQKFLAELDLKRQELGLKVEDQNIKKRTTPGAQKMTKNVTLHRGPDGRVIGGTVEEVPEPLPPPGTLPNGPNIPSPTAH